MRWVIINCCCAVALALICRVERDEASIAAAEKEKKTAIEKEGKTATKNKDGKAPGKIVPDMKKWENDVREKIKKNPEFDKLAKDFPLVVLHSYSLFQKDGYGYSAFSFVHESSEPADFDGDPHLAFDWNRGVRKQIKINFHGGQRHLIAILGKADFRKNPDPTKISIDDKGVTSSKIAAEEGVTYVEWVRDDLGNDFYAMFQILFVDPDSRFMAFVWRRLPGGAVVKKAEPNMVGWEKTVRDRATKDKGLTT